jgi:hypothetical protein
MPEGVKNSVSGLFVVRFTSMRRGYPPELRRDPEKCRLHYIIMKANEKEMKACKMKACKGENM